METLVYKENRQRERWAPGPWDDEPDKVQWQDPHSLLPCLAVRGPMGSWCGYVGGGPTHPWYGKSYDGLGVDVHGGLTFSDSCDDPSPEAFADWQKRWEARKEHVLREAEIHPHGDSAEWLKEWLPLLGDYEKWKAHKQAVSICHIAGPGDFEPAWWFGFDTAHAGDKWPDRKDPLFRLPYETSRDVYRTLEYVQGECARLAKQLAEVAA